jgi:hypothetical protein
MGLKYKLFGNTFACFAISMFKHSADTDKQNNKIIKVLLNNFFRFPV